MLLKPSDQQFPAVSVVNSPDASIEALVSFSHLLSSTTAPEEILNLLVEHTVRHLGADGTTVLEVTDGGEARVAASRGLPELEDFHAELETIGPELGERLLAACGPEFRQAHSLPLVSDGDLHGVLLMLFKKSDALDETRLRVVGGLADLAAASLARTHQYQKLSRAYAELQASREVLARSERLRALGQMAAGVSHDLRNIFAPMLLHLELLKRSFEGRLVPGEVARFEQFVRRGIQIVDRLCDLGRQSSEVRSEPSDLNQLASEAIEFCRPRLQGLNITIELRLEEGRPPLVLLEPPELVTAAVNLVLNAIEAMRSDGSIIIRTGESSGGGWVQVVDTGPGMPKEVQGRIFEPFFTTKGNAGTGLGLAIVYAFVQRNRGNITVDSTPGKGTAFTLWFPSAA